MEYAFYADVLLRTVVLAILSLAIWLLIIRRSKKGDGIVFVNKTLQIIAAMCIIFVITFLNTMASGAVRGNSDARFYIYIMTSMFAFVGILFEYSMCTGKRSEVELTAIKRILREERERYDREKANIEMINIKCHDLRHQIDAYRNKLDREEIRSICEAINVYDAGIHTGCDAMDVVISEKVPVCMKEGIRLTCMLDGRRFEGFPAHEIYSLFGNALENAVEAVRTLPKDKRIISVSDSGTAGFINLCIENYYEGEILFADGLPRSRKSGEGHGYGIKSMRYIVESHGGALRAVVGKDIFRLEIVLPVMNGETDVAV